MMAIDQTEGRDTLSIQITKPSTRYFDELISSKCAPDLLALNIWPNAKEVTESFAAHRAARKWLRDRFPLDDPDVTLVAPGDGCTPRTAATFAFRTAWRCISIDPKLRPDRIEEWEARIRRLECWAHRIEDCAIGARRVVIAAVHSHVPLDAVLNSIQAEEVSAVAIPCCTAQLFTVAPPDIEYIDSAIWSPQRLVRVWRNLDGLAQSQKVA